MMWLPLAFVIGTFLMSILVGMAWSSAGWFGVFCVLAVIGIVLSTIVKGDADV